MTKKEKYDNNEIDGDGKPTGFGAGFGGAYGGGNPFGQGGFYSSSGGQNANFDFSSIFGDDIFSAFGGGSREVIRASAAAPNGRAKAKTLPIPCGSIF